jgi:arylsulfatase
MLWEHEGNRAIRMGDWKLVAECDKDWELYNMLEDRTELNNLAERSPERVEEMEALYRIWAERCGVLPWPFRKGESRLKMRGEHVHLSYHRGRAYLP